MRNTINSIQSFFRLEQSGGIVLMASIVLAMIFAMTPGLDHLYHNLLHSHFSFELLGISIIDKDFHYFINDGLMVIFFFLIGLEVKRELLEGELSNPKNIVLPGLAAVGGLIVPCVIFYFFNKGQPTEAGWAVPAATDIAIAFGVLALLGKKVPTSLKTFLLMLAIFDDVLVVAIIALFFTETISMYYLGGVLLCCALLWFLNYKNISNFAPFAIIGFIMWYFMLKSGVHATIAGILFAAFIPMKERTEFDDNKKEIVNRGSMLKELEHSLHEFVSFLVLPVFAFVNAGFVITMDDIHNLTSPLSLGIILGLFLGKQFGVFAVSFALIKMKVVEMPKNANMMQLYGVAILCGIGFTMGLFIGDLAFKNIEAAFKLPIIIGSVLSAVVGLSLIALGSRKKEIVKS